MIQTLMPIGELIITIATGWLILRFIVLPIVFLASMFGNKDPWE